MKVGEAGRPVSRFTARWLLLACVIVSAPCLANSAHAEEAARPRGLFIDGTVSYVRAEDGLAGIEKSTLSVTQMVPAGRVAAGWRFADYVSAEAYGFLLLSKLGASGTSVMSGQPVEISALYHAIGVNLVGILPIGRRWELAISAGPARLGENATVKMSGATQDIHVGRLGFSAAPSVRFRASDAIVVHCRFDFFDQFGDERVWKGDMAALGLGVGYTM